MFDLRFLRRISVDLNMSDMVLEGKDVSLLLMLIVVKMQS